MTAEILQLRDYQSKKAIERAQKALAEEAAKILNPFTETEGFTEPEVQWKDSDPA